MRKLALSITALIVARAVGGVSIYSVNAGVFRDPGGPTANEIEHLQVGPLVDLEIDKGGAPETVVAGQQVI